MNSILSKTTPSKQFLGVIFFTTWSFILAGQNLIVNPSFENFTKPCKWDITSYDIYQKFNGWIFSNDRWQFNANCFSETTLDKGVPWLVKGKAPFHRNVAISNGFGSCSKQELLQLGFLPSKVDLMIGSLNDTLIPGQKYYFSYHLSPSYYTYFSEFPNGQRLADLSLATSNFVFSSLTAYEASQIMAGKYRYGPPNNGLPPPDYINPPDNIMNGNLDSNWNEVKGVFIADTFSTYFYFGSNGNWWRDEMEGHYSHIVGVDYSDTAGIRNDLISYGGEYTFDAFTLIPYPELGDAVALCHNQLELDPKTPKNRLVWFDGDTTSKTKIITQPGTYWVTARTQFSSITDTIVVLPNKQTTWPDTTVFCLNDEKLLEIDDASNTPIWNETDTVLRYKVSENQNVKVNYRDKQGCETHLSTFTCIDSVSISRITDFNLCESENLIVKPKGTLAQNYTLNNTNFKDSISIKNDGSFKLFANGKFCKDSTQFNVLFEKIEPPYLKQINVCYGDVIEPKKKSEYTPNNNLYIENLANDTVIYYSWSQPLCGLISDSILIKMKACNCEAFVPNAISPDNNGVNDEFSVEIPCDVNQFELLVFNRWGQRIAHRIDEKESIKANEWPIGTYFYILNYSTTNGEEFHQSGNVQVIK
ncbi:MAG: gliding motility-associated C-terminal domain-containing protein [Bacteroidia bacterium]